VQASDGVWHTTAFDPINRPINMWDGVHATPTHYGYDSLYLRSVTDPVGQVYGFGYNALGRVIARTDPLGRADSLAYDADGLLRQWTNRRGQTVAITYDALHRRRTRTGAAITPDTMSYSMDGRIVTASNAVATETDYLNAQLQADSARTVLWIPGGGSQTYWRRYWYNATSAALDSMRPSGGGLFSVARGYAYTLSRGTLDSIRLGVAGWTRLVYDSVLSLRKVQFPEAASDSLTFRTVTAQDVAQTGSSLLQDLIHYDSLGRVDEIRDTVAQWSRQFRYDSLGHLRWIGYSHQVDPLCYAFDPDSGWLCTPTFDSTRTISYDTVGNRTDLGGTYTTGNRIATFNGCTYGEDYDGNDTLRACPGQSVTFGWAADGRLASLATAGGTTVAFQYDAGGRLVRRDVNGTPASYFLWDGDNLLAELGSNAYAQVAQYSYYPGLDRLHAAVDGPWYAQQDVLGNVRFLESYPGAYASYQYDEQGRLVDSGGNGFGFYRTRWKGALEMAPEAGLYYLRSRWYDTQSGRFLSEDPVGLAGGINPYLFAGDDPINGADPTGLGCTPPEVPDPGDPKKCILPGTVPVSPIGVTGTPDPGANVYSLWEFDLFWATMERTCGYNPSSHCIPPETPNHLLGERVMRRYESTMKRLARTDSVYQRCMSQVADQVSRDTWSPVEGRVLRMLTVPVAAGHFLWEALAGATVLKSVVGVGLAEAVIEAGLHIGVGIVGYGQGLATCP
jgi:RHS repeat-associated protein